ncbi:MAG: repeat protein [Daejeonella sp.]|nr:repeat protein [Daejeonella sp.]
MATYIHDLIERMLDKSYRIGEKSIEGTYESAKTISWTAHEEARQLNNSDYYNELCSVIDNTESDDIKRIAYFILGNSAKNCGDIKATEYLLKKLAKEKEINITITILGRLAELYKPKMFDTAQLYKLTASRNWQIRSYAFEALTNNENNVEEFFIERLKTTDKRDDIRPLLSSLMYVGTQKCIPCVEKYMKNRQPFIKDYSISVLAVVMLREKLSFESIQKRLDVSEDFVQSLFNRLKSLTRPG